MDNELFKQKLSQVADWKIPDTPRETSLNAKKQRGRKTNEELYQQAREEIFHTEFGGVNPTYPPMLLSVKNQATLCSDCGCDCSQGRRKEKKLYETGKDKKRNWREKCITCGLHQNPFTGKFDLTAERASHVWTQFLRETKGLYQTAGNQARGELEIKAANPDAEATDQGIITYHPEIKGT